ncbi:hypothetical protein [Helicobacter sp. 23-1045]
MTEFGVDSAIFAREILRISRKILRFCEKTPKNAESKIDSSLREVALVATSWQSIY